MTTMDVVAGVMLAVGGVVWGLVGVLGIEPVSALLGSEAPTAGVYGAAAVAYALVGLLGVWRRRLSPVRRRVPVRATSSSR